MIPFTRLGLQQMQMLGAGAPAAGLPRFITDIFNLLQSSPTYTGGPLTATDYEGNLVTSPAGTPALEGGRFTDGVWYDTELDGTPIQPSVNIPTRSGTKQWYQEPFANPFGYSNWPARTNLLYPSENIAGATLSGCTATATILIETTTSGSHRVSLGATGILVGSPITYSARVASGLGRDWVLLWKEGDARGAYFNITTGTIGTVSAGVSASITSNVDGSYLCAITLTPTSTATVSFWICSANETVNYSGDVTKGINIQYLQLETGTFATPKITTTTTTVTRAATNLTNPLTLAPQLQLVVIPATTGTAGTMLDDGTNKLSYNGTNLIFTDGVTTLSAAATLTAGTAYTIGVKGLAGDWALSLNTVDLDTDATGTVVAWATAKLGRNDADGDYFAGYFPNVAGYVGTDVNWYKTTLGA